MPTQQRKKQGNAQAAPERTSEAKGKTSKVGNLTRDPELMFSVQGEAYANCRMAVEEPVVPGEWSGERTTTFYDLTVFGSMAENFAQSCTKGMRVVVMGRAFLETWVDAERKTQQSRKILADAVGPDLRWSTAEVTKVTRSALAQTSNQPDYADEEPF